MRLTVIATALALGGLSATAHADPDAKLRQARAKMNAEPKVDEVVRVALQYFRVHPDTMDSLRTAARARGVLPLLAAGYRLDHNDHNGTVTQFDGDPVFTRNDDFGDVTHAGTIGAVWDLRQLVFNPAEIQVYGLIGVQRDLMLEATRVYFLRRQLSLRMYLRPPEDPIAKEALQLRIDEFSSLLDILTGGWFSKQLAS